MPNKSRLKKLVSLKEKHWKLQIAKAAQAERNLNDIISHEQQINNLLAGDGVASQLFLTLTLSKLQQVAIRKHEARAELEHQRSKSQELGKGVKMLENMLENIENTDAREEAARELREAADLFIHPSGFRLPQG